MCKGHRRLEFSNHFDPWMYSCLCIVIDSVVHNFLNLLLIQKIYSSVLKVAAAAAV